MRTVTCIIRDNASGYTDPLIYTVKVPESLQKPDIEAAVLKERIADTGCDASELDLDVLLVFVGNVCPVRDWRE